MAIIRAIKKSNYTVVDNGFINDKTLSFKAKGVMLYLLSKPSDWQVYTNEIIKNSTDGKASIANALKELEEAGYIEREYKRGEAGLYTGGYEYTVYEVSIQDRNSPKADYRKSDNRKAEKRKSDNRKADKRNSDNQSLLSTESKLNTEYIPNTEAKGNIEYILSTETTTTTKNKEEIKSSSCSSGNEDIYNIYTDNGFGNLTKDKIKIIDRYINKYTKEEVENAFIEAIKKDRCNLSYIEGILENWRNKGGKTNGKCGTSYEEELRRDGLIFDFNDMP